MNEKKIPAPNEPDWFVPPGLFPEVENFVILYDTLFKESGQKKRSHILIHGPRGVGKTLFTKIFEQCYGRDHKVQQVMRVNCAAISQTLIESELFGHARGAFTGSVQAQPGYIKQAENGILILEEVGELPRYCQAKLLTFLDSGIYYPVGDKQKVAENVQIIGTTNQNIFNEEQMRADFRDRFDLFYVPPIFTRRQDILYYLQEEYPQLVEVLCPHQVLPFLAYNWPGNVREIEQVAKTILVGKEVARRWFSEKSQNVYPFLFPEKGHTGFNAWRSIDLSKKLPSSIADSVDSRLRKSALGLYFSEENSFPG